MAVLDISRRYPKMSDPCPKHPLMLGKQSSGHRMLGLHFQSTAFGIKLRDRSRAWRSREALGNDGLLGLRLPSLLNHDDYDHSWNCFYHQGGSSKEPNRPQRSLCRAFNGMGHINHRIPTASAA